MTLERYRTTSGSIYEVELDADGVGGRMRRVLRSSTSKSQRAGEGDWRAFRSFLFSGIGRPLVFCWGTGRDEHSANAQQFGTDGKPDGAVTRLTETTPVAAVLETEVAS